MSRVIVGLVVFGIAIVIYLLLDWLEDKKRRQRRIDETRKLYEKNTRFLG